MRTILKSFVVNIFNNVGSSSDQCEEPSSTTKMVVIMIPAVALISEEPSEIAEKQLYLIYF